MRILVVEDEEAIARGLRFNFEREGYQVDLVSSGPAETLLKWHVTSMASPSGCVG